MLTALEDLPLMVAREQVRGLSFSDLAFQVDEIQALIQKNSNVLLSDEEAQKLFEESEGWITGLQFGIYGANHRPESKMGVGLYDFLGQQVVDRQDPKMRELLLRTSIMDEFDAALCEAVLAPLYDSKQDWDAFIRTILTNNLFAIPVGAEGGYLRYHHIFRDYLRQRMEKERGDEAKFILMRLSNAYEAEGEWEKAYAIIQQLGDVDALAELIDLASFNNLQNTGRLVENWLRELPPSTVKNLPPILSVQGTLKLIHGDYRDGMADLERAIESFRKKNDVSQLTLALIRHSFGPRYFGNYQAALRNLDEALELTEERDDLQALYAEGLRIKSACLMRLGENHQALKCLEQALDVLIRLDKQKRIPEILIDIGSIYHLLGNYIEAEHTLLKVLKIWKQEGNLWAQSTLLNNMGHMYHQYGEYEKAAATYEDGLLCSRRSRHTRMEALISIGIGDLYSELQDFEIAEQNYAYAERMLEERDDLFLSFSLHLGRANMAMFQKDFASVTTLVQTIEKITKTSPSHYENGHFDLLLGKLHLLQDAPENAIARMNNAIVHFDHDGLMLELASVRVWLAAAYIASQQWNKATETIKKMDGGKPMHTALYATGQCRKWLDGLQKDAEVGRVIRDLLSKAEKLTTRLPHVRRELRRHARVVDVPTAQLIVKGLGNAAVSINGKELTPSDWQTQSVRELFFFFLSHPRPLTKEQVAEQFWRELDDPAKVRLRFKNEMYRLRRAVGNDVILFDGQHYSFNHSLNYEYDVEAFESYIARVKSAGTNEEKISLYRKAVELMDGPYLNDIYYDWVIADRERLNQMYLLALDTLAELYQKEAKLDEALAICQQAIAYQPFHESTYRNSMQIHYRLGNRAALINTYEACKTALRKHLSLPPSKETEELYRKLIS
jgi:ATP/maltotriose-dependent transcriptional regulator MalT/two-component SAPR family response regulator